ncbi:PEP/pyruvate-binding domain-containing protein [Cyclobacterium jeungdonense]|uniref:Phosphoenolpyruvate synthase n=1 Tax=Cyclobacterium jeungdonense TaxID=708087 RepID=A0ABT8CER1_9BACT|nr:PEP/pyruvate-binding domain-containing protein [Cyclobacterium jeungdonense]MDN3690166.1 PEP/pyruvate-binding domain-containing protein [Cyclobacterium jeungdonense]
MSINCIPFSSIKNKVLPLVGGRNASFGEMLIKLSPLGIKIPDGFAVTTKAFRTFIQENHLYEKSERPITGVNGSPTERSVFCLSDQDIQTYAKWSFSIEKHYKMPKEIEWAKESSVKIARCGQAPCDYPQFAGFFEALGKDRVSFTPDALLKGIENISIAELKDSIKESVTKQIIL